jgi:hypothetical protein
VAGAVVALDDGSSVTTGSEGRFHLPDLDSGPRVLKIDLARLGMPALPTTDPTRVVDVSPGLVATVRFGVWFAQDTLSMGHPLGKGLAIITDPMEQAVHVAGNAVRGSVLVNGRPVPVRTVDARLDAESSGRILKLVGDRIDSTTAFTTMLSDEATLRWWLEIQNSRHQIVQSLRATAFPACVPTAACARTTAFAVGTSTLSAHVSSPTAWWWTGPPLDRSGARLADRTFTLPGDAFQPGAPPSRSASELPTAGARHQAAPREVVVIEAISTRSDRRNRRCLQRRADGCKLPGGTRRRRAGGWWSRAMAKRVRWRATDRGRPRLNNRIEIYGMTAEVKRS